MTAAQAQEINRLQTLVRKLEESLAKHKADLSDALDREAELKAQLERTRQAL